MDAAELARWTRFAGKGGIGKCTAVMDCVAKGPEDLMFLKVRSSLCLFLSFFFIVLVSFIRLCVSESSRTLVTVVAVTCDYYPGFEDAGSGDG